jgi:hypothetical protein
VGIDPRQRNGASFVAMTSEQMIASQLIIQNQVIHRGECCRNGAVNNYGHDMHESAVFIGLYELFADCSPK